MAVDRWLYAWGLSSCALGGASLLVPLYFVTVGGGAVALGLLAGVAAAAGAPGAILAGRAIDATGNSRTILVGALGTVGAVLFALPLLDDPALIIVANGVLWLAAGAAAPVLTLLVTAGVPEARWNERFGRLNVYAGWGWAGGLVAGTVWTAGAAGVLGPTLAQRSFFVVCGLAGAAGFLLAVRLLPADTADPTPLASPEPEALTEAVTVADRPGIRSATFPVVGGRLYWLVRSMHPRQVIDRFTPALSVYFLAVVATFVGFGIFWGPLPLYLGDLGYSSSLVFALYLASSLGSAASYAAAGRLAGSHAHLGLYGVGLLGRALFQPAVGLVGLALPLALPGIAITAVLFVGIGIAWALLAVTSALIVARLAPAAIRGEAIGLYTAIIGVANGAGAVLGGAVGAWSFPVAFGLSGGCVLLGALLVGALWWARRGEAAQASDAASSISDA